MQQTKSQLSKRREINVESQKRLTLSRKTLRQFAKTSPFLKSVIAQEKVLKNEDSYGIRTYIKLTIERA